MEDIAFDAEEKHCLYCDKVTIHIKRFEHVDRRSLVQTFAHSCNKISNGINNFIF